MQGSGQLKRDFKTAIEFFKKSLIIDPENTLANFELGVLHMLGLGTEKNIPKAIEYLEMAQNDYHAQNALGVIYYEAPDIFDQDPVRKNAYGAIRRDLSKARKHFEKAANGGNLNAKYNLGVLWL